MGQSNNRKQTISADKYVVSVIYNDSSTIFKLSDSTSFEVAINEVSIVNGVPIGVIPNVEIVADTSSGIPIFYMDLGGTGNWIKAFGGITGGEVKTDTLVLYGIGSDSIKITIPEINLSGDIGTGKLGLGDTLNFRSGKNVTVLEVINDGNNNLRLLLNLNFSNLDSTDTGNIATKLMTDSVANRLFKDSLHIDSIQYLLDNSIDSIKFINDSISIYWHRKEVDRIRSGIGLITVDTVTIGSSSFIDVAFDLPTTNIENELEIVRDGFSCTHGRDYTIGLNGVGLRRRITFIIPLLNERVRIELRL